jgi:hypothetical protein
MRFDLVNPRLDGLVTSLRRDVDDFHKRQLLSANGTRVETILEGCH